MDNQAKAYIIDYSSIFILTRGIIENYLVLDYIYLNDLSEEEKIFRYKLWEISGFITRQNFGFPGGTELDIKKEQEKDIIKAIKEEIKQMPGYNNLNTNKLRALETFGLPRIESWHKMIQSSKLKNELFSTAYSLFSSYAHSEYLSIIQIREINFLKNDPQNISNVRLSLSIVKMVNALIAKWLVKKFDILNGYYNDIPNNIRMAIEIYSDVALDVNH